MCCEKNPGGAGSPKKACCRCFCLPYNDIFFITAQVTSIFAVTLSWIWIPQWTLGFITTVLLQVPWCCRMHRHGISIAAFLSLLCAAFSMFTSVYVLFDWKGVQFCKPMVILMDDDDDFDWRNDEEDDMMMMMMMKDDDESTGNENSVNEKQDWCREGVYSGLALLDAVLWMIVGGCLLYFLRRGRLDQAWNTTSSVSGHAEEADEPTSSSTELEMGDVDDRRGGYTPATLATASESDTSLSLSSSVTAPLRTHEYQPL